ncbi:MAG: hypothetical protein ACREEM_08790 [Blastocatellia bacterium]
MNRREFTKAGLSTLGAPLLAKSNETPAAAQTRPTGAQGRTLFNAYYFRAHMYTCVPRHIRDDMRWMADIGTNIITLAVLEQDLFAAVENIRLVCEEAAKAGLQVYAVPSRWGGLAAGAPKAPSLFSVEHPHTWMRNKDGTPVLNPQVSGVISSVHYPETYQFFRESFDSLFKQFPIKGIIWDEPKGFREDYSPKAVEALGPDAPPEAHYQATADFYGRVSKYVKDKYPDKTVCMFVQAHSDKLRIELAARISPLDYFGCDGRPWDLAEDRKWKSEAGNESGKGKVLLGSGEQIIALGKQHGKKTLMLAENHNLPARMIPAMDAGLPKVLGLGVDQLIYYYYPVNIQQPDVNMSVVARHIKAYTKKQR